MSNEWSQKQFAMELLARGAVMSAESAISCVERFERLWAPVAARIDATGRELHRIATQEFGPNPTPQEISDAVRRAHTAGQAAFDAIDQQMK